MSKDFSITDQRSVDLVTQALPGNGASSPNSPENKDARHAEAQREIARIQADRRAREDAVRNR